MQVDVQSDEYLVRVVAGDGPSWRCVMSVVMLMIVIMMRQGKGSWTMEWGRRTYSDKTKMYTGVSVYELSL